MALGKLSTQRDQLRWRPPVVPDNLLEQTLEATQPTDEPTADQSSSHWAAVIRDLVRPHVVPGKPPKQADMVECVDQATAVLMRCCRHRQCNTWKLPGGVSSCCGVSLWERN